MREWVVLISNDIPDACQAMCVYRDKDVVEKSFPAPQEQHDLGRLRVHSDNADAGEAVCRVPRIHPHAEINKTMDKAWPFIKNYTMRSC